MMVLQRCLFVRKRPNMTESAQFNNDKNVSYLMTKPTNGCAPSKDSDQPGHPPSLIKVFAMRSMDSERSKLSSCGQ